ncbi:MAG: hypothetical protein H5T95_05410 [Firmicutes bacterium]|nr:hypothetical protein [Bacillota bacterium]
MSHQTGSVREEVGIIKAKGLVWTAAAPSMSVVAGTMIRIVAMANVGLAQAAQAAQAAESESGTIQHERVCDPPEGCTRNTSRDCGTRSNRPCHGRS